MKSLALFTLLMGVLTISSATWSQNGVTYSGLIANRFGDYLVSYCNCRWLAHIYDLEFYYNPFQYIDQLTASTCHKQAKDHTQKNSITLASALEITSTDSDVLYITRDQATEDIEIDWDDRSFLEILKREISPLNSSILQKIEFPANHFSIALHVRRGGGADRSLFQEDVVTNAEGINVIYKQWPTPEQWDESQCADKIWPTRFPSDLYYIEQLKALIRMHSDKKIYVHLFTDDPSPEKIAAKYEAALNNPQVHFGYRKENNSHDTNVLEDFFSFMAFDALIRSASNYSKIAAAIAEIPYEVFPTDSRWEGRKLITTQISIIERSEGKVTIQYINLEN